MANILIVDDNEPIRQILGSVLSQQGHDVIEAADGDMAVKTARAETPDLIIMDMNMPKMTGWEVGPILRSHPETRDIPIIALTADTSTEGREKAYAAGCDFFVVKPLAADRILRAVNASLRAPSPRADAGDEAEKQSPRRILVVDDDEVMRTLIGGMVAAMGAEVVGEAGNGEDAVAAYERLRPDLMLLDVNMPVKNGVDALQEIIALDAGATVVMLSANDDTAVAESCLYEGARNYIRKGAGPEDLQSGLMAVLGALGAG